MSVQSAINSLLWSKDLKNKIPSKQLIARIKREWDFFLKTLELINFTEEHITTIFSGDLYGKVAHDWIMTRNGEGCGFWDGNYDKQMGEKLTEICNNMGTLEIYESKGFVYPYSIVYLNKIASYCYIKWVEVPQRFEYGENASPFLIKLPEIDNRWRRVYSICYSNSSSEFVYVKEERICLGDLLTNEIFVDDESKKFEI